MDKAAMWEISNIIDNINYIDKENNLQMRLQSYLIAKANFKGINKIEDVYSLPWDKAEEEEDENILSLEELSKMGIF